MAISCTTAEADSLAKFFTAQKVLEAEMLEPRIGPAFKVSAQNGQAVPGGMMLGPQALDAGSIAPLAQRAFKGR